MRPHHLILPILGAGLLFIGVPKSDAVQANLDLRATGDIHAAGRSSLDNGSESHLRPSSSMGSLRSATNDRINYYAFCVNGSESEHASVEHGSSGKSKVAHDSNASNVVRAHGHGEESLSDNGHGSNGSTHEGICPAVAGHGGKHNGNSSDNTGGGSCDLGGGGSSGGSELGGGTCSTGEGQGNGPPSSSHDVPEPASAVLVAAGVLGMIGLRRK